MSTGRCRDRRAARRSPRAVGTECAKVTALVLALLIGSSLLACSERPPQNIVLIVVDTLRRDHLSPYGAALETPNMQTLADRGQVYTNLLASFHQTTMSMGALFSGHTPSIESEDPRQTLRFTGRTWCGLSRFARQRLFPPVGCIPPEVETLPERLQRGGWFTAGVVSNRLLFSPAGFERGFDVWQEIGVGPEVKSLDRAERMALRSAPQVLAGVGAALTNAPREPLFLYVHYIDVHDWIPTGRSYTQAVEEFDVEFGKLLGALEADGLLDDSVVILTSDHGEALGEEHPIRARSQHWGNPSFQSVLEVPLIIAPPIDRDPDRMLRSQDLATVIAQIAGLPPVAGSVPSPLEPGELLLTERRFLTYQRGRWKSIHHRKNPAKSALFDLTADPSETVNLQDLRRDVMEAHQQRIAEIREGLRVSADPADDLTEADRERLRALGYLE